MFFDLQRFGGKGGTTIQSTYEPTEFELRLQALEVELTEQVLIPSAKKLGQTAYNQFEGVTANIQAITNDIQQQWLDSKNLIDTALEGLRYGQTYLAESLATLDAMTDDMSKANNKWGYAASELTGNYKFYIKDQNKNARNVNNKLQNLPEHLSSAYEELEGNLKIIGGYWGQNNLPNESARIMDYNLSNISEKNYRDLDRLKPTLESALDIEFAQRWKIERNEFKWQMLISKRTMIG